MTRGRVQCEGHNTRAAPNRHARHLLLAMQLCVSSLHVTSCNMPKAAGSQHIFQHCRWLTTRHEPSCTHQQTCPCKSLSRSTWRAGWGAGLAGARGGSAAWLASLMEAGTLPPHTGLGAGGACFCSAGCCWDAESPSEGVASALGGCCGEVGCAGSAAGSEAA